MRRHRRAAIAATSTHRRSAGPRRPTTALLIAAVAAIVLALGASAASAEAPTVSIDTATDASYASAKISGTVDPKDLGTYWSFQTSTDGGATWSPFNWDEGFLTEGTGLQSVPPGGPRELTGLIPGIEYKVRLAANNRVDPEVISSVESFTTLPVGPPTVSIDPPSDVTPSSAHFSGQIDPEAPLGNPSAFDVNWRFECTPECPGLEGTIPADSDPHTVAVDADLKPGTSYEVTLVAENAAGPVSAGPESFATAATPPQILLTKATPLITEATLEAQINPGGLATTYRFQYGPTSAYGQSTATETIPAGADAVTVKAQLFGLSPSTAYRYRLLATNAQGTSAGPDQGFATLADGTLPLDTCANADIRTEQGSQYLPDCRAYELVSPANKLGYDVGGNMGFPNMDLKVRADGDLATYRGDQPLPPSQAGSFAGLRVERSAGGWVNSGILPKPGPNQLGWGYPGDDAHLLGTTPDQRVSVYWDSTTAPWGSLGIVRADGSRQTIVAATATPCFTYGGNCTHQAFFQGMSEDGRHVVFSSIDPHAPGVSVSGNDILYEWVDDGSNGGAGTIRVVNRTNDEALNLIDPGAAELGAEPVYFDDRNGYRKARHAVSTDGSRIFFQTPAPDGPVYLRENGATTVEVSRPEGANPPATRFKYLDAAADGSVVYFWADSALTDEGSGPGIYRYDVGAGSLHLVDDLSPDGFGNLPSAFSSDDGSRLVFWGADGMEVAVDGVVRTALPIAAEAQYGPLEVLRDSSCPTIGFTSDGRYVVFGPSTVGGKRAYRYDTVTGEAIDVSTTAYVSGSYYRADFNSACEPDKKFPRPSASRAISEDGQYVFFDTAGALVPADTNRLPDVYRWKQGGKVELVSPGIGHASYFAGIDASGANAFFVTRNRLAPQDGDALLDIYDARVGGGFAMAVRPSCEGDACQGAPESGRPYEPPASSELQGRGNPRLKSRGRCAKAHRKAKAKSRKAKSRKGGSASPDKARKLHREAAIAKQTARKCRRGGRS